MIATGKMRAGGVSFAALAGGSLVAMALAAPALAGGFAIREQSASSQGASFAGSAANTDLSAMFWNPAGAANVSGPGLNTESHIAVIIPSATVTVETIGGAPVPAAVASSDIADWAVVPASYASMQVGDRLFLGMSTNGGFGLTTKPDNLNYAGSPLGRTSKLFTTNMSPTVAYQVAPWMTIGAGLQVQYATGKFAFGLGPVGTSFEGDDIAFGATAGIMLTPARGTRIGLGWRSALTHELKGNFSTFNGAALIANVNGKAELNLPDIVTLSINQAISQNVRLLGTVEWSSWSRFKQLQVITSGPGTAFANPPGVVVPVPGGLPIATVPAGWSDGWFFSLGGEYDYSRQLTLRAGAGYEISPVDDPTKRIIGIPDSDRIWLSLGGTYRLTEMTSIDFAYTHIFLDDARFVRNPPGSATVFTGSVEASTDIVSFSYKTRWGGHTPLK
ncbi:MAG: outer membrane protein transport protein [Hyphomicrobiaceae bacterium]